MTAHTRPLADTADPPPDRRSNRLRARALLTTNTIVMVLAAIGTVFFATSCGKRGEKPAADSSAGMAGMSHGGGGGSDTAAGGPVHLSADRQQFLGVVLTAVTRRPLVREVRTVGRVEYDERRLAFVNLKFGGWIERLDVDFTGVFVRRGESLFSIYSPELVSAQEEYLLALKGVRGLSPAADSGVASAARNVLGAARQRLEWWDIRDDHIRELADTGKPRRTLEVHSPIDGYVIEKMAIQGMRVEPGMNLYKIADVSRVWVDASIYEYEVSLIKVGQDATVALPYTPGKVLHGRISYVYPYLDEATRTVRVRIDFANPNGALKPGMYAEAVVRSPQGTGLAVPKSAILDTGSRKLVFVSRGEGRFDPRTIRTGIEAGDYYEVLEGLVEGEQVVTSANFLIDSESQLSTATGKMKH